MLRWVAAALAVAAAAAAPPNGTTAAAGGPPTPRRRCAFAKTPGRQQGVACHGITYDLDIPPQCLTGTSCGLIIDVHGGSMNGTWEEAITEMSVYARPMNCLTLQATAGPGLPPDSSWSGTGGPCADLQLPALDDIEREFSIDTRRIYMTGSSQGGMCTNNMMNREEATAGRFAAFAPAAAPFTIPAVRRSFLWFTARYDFATCLGRPAACEQDMLAVAAAWDLTEHTVVSRGAMYEHHRWANAAGTLEAEWVMHDYVGGPLLGHCAPGGRDAPPNPAYPASGTRLSCPQPDPKSAEEGAWHGKVISEFFQRH